MEDRAFPILFEFYREISDRYTHRLAAAEMICRDLDVRLVESNSLSALQAFLLPGYKIQVPYGAGPERRGFLIYHELAHWRLQTKDSFFVRSRERLAESDFDLKEEYWCDAFATAMLFAWVGCEVLSKENHAAFFAAGTEDEKGSLDYRSAIRDIHFGNKIHSLNKAHFVSPHEGFTTLANDLLIEGAKNLSGKKFWGH